MSGLCWGICGRQNGWESDREKLSTVGELKTWEQRCGDPENTGLLAYLEDTSPTGVRGARAFPSCCHELLHYHVWGQQPPFISPHRHWLLGYVIASSRTDRLLQDTMKECRQEPHNCDSSKCAMHWGHLYTFLQLPPDLECIFGNTSPTGITLKCSGKVTHHPIWPDRCLCL